MPGKKESTISTKLEKKRKAKVRINEAKGTSSAGSMKKIGEEVVFELKTGEEVLPIGPGVDVIINQGSTLQITKEHFVITPPSKTPSLPSPKEK